MIRRARAVPRLAAASDGASAALVRRALALDPGAGLDEGARWASIALATRLGQDITPLLDRHAERSEHLQRWLRLVDPVRGGANPSTAEAQLNGLAPAARGQPYGMGVIILGDRAPAAWRHAAKQLLFVPERPYVK